MLSYASMLPPRRSAVRPSIYFTTTAATSTANRNSSFQSWNDDLLSTLSASKMQRVEIRPDVEVVHALMTFQGPHQGERQGKGRDLPEHHDRPSRKRHQDYLARRHSSGK